MASPAEVLSRLLREGVLLAVTVLLGAAGGVLYANTKAPTYTARAYVAVVARSSSEPTTAVNFAQAYGRIATQGEVLARAATKVGTGGSVDSLRQHVRASTSPDAPIVQITGSAGTARRAADVANAVASALVSFGADRARQTTVKVVSFASATPPSAPTSPNPPLDIAVGAAAGLLIGGLALLAGVGRPASAQERAEPERAEPERVEPVRAGPDRGRRPAVPARLGDSVLRPVRLRHEPAGDGRPAGTGYDEVTGEGGSDDHADADGPQVDHTGRTRG